MNNLKIPYAIRKSDGQIIHISEVPQKLKGLKCDCKCPDEKCGIDLMARIGDVRQPHFSHQGGTCNGNGIESGAHKYAKKIITESKYIIVPEIKKNGITLATKKRLEIDYVELEKNVGQFRPDAIVWTTPGTIPTFVEIYYKHKTDEKKQEKIIKNDVDAIEIDISNAPVEIPDKFREFIIDSVKNKKWLFNSQKETLYHEYEKSILLEEQRIEKEEKIREEIKRKYLKTLEKILSDPNGPEIIDLPYSIFTKF